MKRTHRILASIALTGLALALSACGGGGGGGGSSGTGGGTPAASNSQTLLAQYPVPANIAAAVVTNYSGPAFNVGNSGMQSACSGTVSSTVVDAPDVVVFSANGASLKAQEVAAALFEQAVPQIRTALGLSSSGVAFDGTNKVQLCVDTALGQSSNETGTSLEGQTNLGSPGPVMQVMSADSPNFDARYPGASSYTSPVGQSYYTLFAHEGTHAALYSLAEPFGGMETFFQEGTAQLVAQQSMGTKANVLAIVQGTDILTTGNLNTNMDVYPAYEATMSYLTSSAAGGLGYGLTNLPTFIAAYKAAAMAACAQPIPNGIIPPASQTQGMPAGDYNVCVGGAGTIDARVQAAFDTAFNSTFKDSNSSPLLLHTADGSNSLEATLYARLNGFLQ